MPRCSSGWALRNASSASFLSCAAIAVSTFLTKVLIRLSRAVLTAVRRRAWRIRFSADLFFLTSFCAAMAFLLRPNLERINDPARLAGAAGYIDGLKLGQAGPWL